MHFLPLTRSGVVYGSHPRQCLDVFRPATESAAAPFLGYFHGGGFIRGGKQNRAHVGAWGASLVFVRCSPTSVCAGGSLAERPGERGHGLALCPGSCAGLGGDPSKIVLVGESAATLMTRFQPPGWRIAGAALLSGHNNTGLEARAPQALGIAQPDVRDTASFGDDPALWHRTSIVGQVDAAPFPLLISAAERDLVQMQVQTGELFARLAMQHGFAPGLLWWAGHDRFASGMSLGSDDFSVGEPLAAFVRRCTGG